MDSMSRHSDITVTEEMKHETILMAKDPFSFYYSKP